MSNIPITDHHLSEQISRLVSENQHFRVKSENDEKTIHLLKQQYSGLSATVNGIRDKHAREMHDLTTERDEAVVRHQQVTTLLLQAADIVMQALRANEGDTVPLNIPDRVMPHIIDDRLPIARLS